MPGLDPGIYISSLQKAMDCGESPAMTRDTAMTI
jgi:hypothetical protein